MLCNILQSREKASNNGKTSMLANVTWYIFSDLYAKLEYFHQKSYEKILKLSTQVSDPE